MRRPGADQGAAEIRRAGRPTKLTPELRAVVAAHLRNVTNPWDRPTLKATYAAVGLLERTATEWLARGEGRSDRPRRKEYTAFAAAVRRAQETASRRLDEELRRWWDEKRRTTTGSSAAVALEPEKADASTPKKDAEVDA